MNFEDIPVELFMHPISQAVDILLYKFVFHVCKFCKVQFFNCRATRVPAGGYQFEYLQLAQEIAKMFNQKYGLRFPIPQFTRDDGTFSCFKF